MCRGRQPVADDDGVSGYFNQNLKPPLIFVIYDTKGVLVRMNVMRQKDSTDNTFPVTVLRASDTSRAMTTLYRRSQCLRP